MAGNQAWESYLQGANLAREQGVSGLQQMGLMSQLQAAAQKQQQEQQMQAERAALGPNPSQETLASFASKYAAPGDIMRTHQGSLDRKAALDSANINRDAQREQRLHELEIRGQQRRDEIDQQAQQGRITQAQAAADRATLQTNMARLAASLRQAPQEQAPVAVIGPDGKSVLVSRRDAIGKTPASGQAERVVPAPIAKAYIENNTALAKLDRADAAVAAYPTAFGLHRLAGDTINQRVDPQGVDARAIISDIGSLKIHDRSGAAVTAAEAPRLKPFIPKVDDTPETIAKKLASFRKEYQQIQADIGSIYSKDQGYKELPASSATPTTPTAGQNRIRFDAQGNRIP